MNPNIVEYTVQLAILASLVDGQASDQEKGLIVELVSHHLKFPQEQVGQMLDRWLNMYKEQGVGTNPGAALHFAYEALRPLQFNERHLAFYICDRVVRHDNGINTVENSFIQDLSRLVFS